MNMKRVTCDSSYGVKHLADRSPDDANPKKVKCMQPVPHSVVHLHYLEDRNRKNGDDKLVNQLFKIFIENSTVFMNI